MERAEEQACIERAQGGSLDDFDRLMAAWEDRLFRFLRLRGLSHADAQDALQETFLKAFSHLRSYRPRWRFSTWLFTIAVREAARNRHGVPVEFIDRVAAEDGTPLDHCLAFERRDNLWPMARRILSDDQFTALWLYYGEGFDVAEVARALRRSRPWVKVNLHRARKRLADALASAERATGRRIHDAPIRT